MYGSGKRQLNEIIRKAENTICVLPLPEIQRQEMTAAYAGNQNEYDDPCNESFSFHSANRSLIGGSPKKTYHHGKGPFSYLRKQPDELPI